jgi:ATP-dependent helicase/nuclease subunit B
MATTTRAALENTSIDHSLWGRIVALVGEWAREHSVELRDAAVLVPFAQLLPLARGAFAQAGGWSPRIETTRTLAASLGPPAPSERAQISFDAAVDVLTAAQLLRSQAWGAAWAGRDPRGFEQAVDHVVATSHAIARAAAALPPAERAAHWARAREQLAPVAGPGASARLLARVALEWASLAPAPITDRLFTLQPSAWIVVQAGGPDALCARLQSDASVPGLLIDGDAPEDEPFRLLDSAHAPSLAVCDSFEDEAASAAATVLEHLRCGHQPVALVAQDRALVRRVRALLERQQVSVLDETGWKLSTTRAAAQVMSLLGAARPDARIDALFDWLRAGTVWSAQNQAVALAALESECRRLHVTSLEALLGAALDERALGVWAGASAVLRDLAAPRRLSLHAWLAGLALALQRCGSMPMLAADEAGRQVLVALRLDVAGAAGGAWASAASEFTMSFGEFSSWVDRVLEQETFRPVAGSGAQVVIVPLARAMLRPFAAMVFPGADDQHLGAPVPPHALLADAQMHALGLPDAAQRRRAELLAFGQALRTPRITLLHRRADGAEPLTASPLLERLALALGRSGREFAPWHDPGHLLSIEPTPIHCSAPHAASLLPERLSASACEAFRACPYRFFALHLLRLREEDELDAEVEKRDYGNWLHHVLHVFHQERAAPADAAAELSQLHAVARASQAEQGLDEAAFLPFAASFAAFAPRYVTWLHARDAEGARWLSGESPLSIAPTELGGLALHGIIDRVDAVRTQAGEAQQLIDYKTGHVNDLKAKVNDPLEDTQLAFYAALAGAQTTLPLRAIYLAVDGTSSIDEVEHKNVAASAAALVHGLAHDLSRVRGGAGLPALGEGSTCDFCAARGVCRRDHWSAPQPRPGA